MGIRGRNPADRASKDEPHGWELEGGTLWMGIRRGRSTDGNSMSSPHGWEFEVGDAQMETLRNLKGEDPQMVIQGRNPVDGM